MKQLAIVTVIYNNYEVTRDFLNSLTKQKNKNFHLFLVNLSLDKPPEGSPFGHPSGDKIAISNWQLTTINGPNRGYAYGINLGLKKAIKEGFQYFCVINNDTYFQDNFVDSILTSILDHPSFILGGKIYYAPGFEYHKDRYSKPDLGNILWYAGGEINWNNVLTPHRGVDEIDNGQYSKFERTDFITGCLMIFDKKVIDKVGFWDERYFLYYEDADYCERAKRKEINLFYDPSIVIWHKNAQSTGGAGSTTHQQHQNKNRLRFGLKYAPLKTKVHLLKNYLFK